MWLGDVFPDPPELPDDAAAGAGELAGPLAAGVDEVASWSSDGVAVGGPADADAGDPDGPEDPYAPLPFDTITALDQDGDGVLETMIVAGDDGDITVSYDLDGDGRTDYETVFDSAGRATSWQDQQDADGSWHWRRVQ